MKDDEKLYKPVIVRHELDDSHYYYVDDVFVPSVTQILDSTEPMPYALRKWIGDVGNDTAEQKYEQAALRGSLLHSVVERLLLGEEVKTYDELPDDRDRKVVSAFINWFHENQPVLGDTKDLFGTESSMPTVEFTVANKVPIPAVFGYDQEATYAGTVDIFCYLNDEPYILDIKSSSGVYDKHFLQVTAYRDALYSMASIYAKRGILHLNHRTKAGITFVDDHQFKVGKRLVQIEDFMINYCKFLFLNGGKVPDPPEQIVYPDKLSLFEEK